MSRPIRAMVVDDEPLARRALRALLAEDPDVELVGEHDGVEALEAIPQARPDLLFLDVQMPGVDGFTLLERVGVESIPAVVFVTAFDRHALRAFDMDAVDYLLKPFDDARFALALGRAKEALRDVVAGASPPTTSGEGPPRHLRRFVVRSGDRILIVRVADVDWIEAADYYARIHVGARGHLLRQTMGELEAGLDPAQFFRVSRSAIVNLDRIRELVPLFKGEYSAVLADGTRLRLPRGRLEELRARLVR